MISSNELQVLLFSKDRPWQAKEYLRTFRKYVSADIKPKVIWKASNEAFKKAYEDLWTKGWCEPISEEDYKGTFKELVLQTIDKTKPYLMFGCDDILWCNLLTDEIYSSGLNFLKITPNSFSFSLRLDPNMRFCHPAQNINKIPRFQKINNILIYNRLDGWGDFDYVFNLTSTLYRTTDILSIIKLIEFKNPNQLEASGAQLFMGFNNQYGLINGCLEKTLCYIVTINRVQDEFCNPIFEEKTTESLLNNYWKNLEFDDVVYGNKQFKSVHIGEYILNEKT
jgi:hypothetical protein